MSVRVRFAPSPTGHIHVGNVRTALFNFLYARNLGGKFILRIEDTDLERSTNESEELIYEDLRWLGLQWDEGEGVGGDYGPYRQTERLDIYEKTTEKLLNQGDAYHCFCSMEELDEARELALKEGRPPIYNGKCSRVPFIEAEKRVDDGERAAVRFRVQKPFVVVKDLVHGDVTFPTNSFGDFIIVRPDGVPIYNYVVVVDDIGMKISHVIRGDDHLPNTPKQILIYDALGASTPIFAHIPMILGADRSKLSKRHGNTSVEQFRETGYLPEAMVNFMALLSWSPEGEEEIFDINELIKRFSMKRVSSSAAVFDFDKLKWMNGMYIRAADIGKITELAVPYVLKAGLFDQEYYEGNRGLVSEMVLAIRDNLEVLNEAPKYLEVFFKDVFELDEDAKEILALPTTERVLKSFINRLEVIESDTLTAEEYKDIVKEVQRESETKGRPLFMAIRVGMTGKTKGPELDKFVPLMKVETLIKRVKQIIK